MGVYETEGRSRAVIALKEAECYAPGGARASSNDLAPAGGSPAA